ncbi:hypothetical protein CBS101457_000939 [Exobasidium rhododendri]|nr:hypothetical protein CBS101457_000939 [Exobasidium rhododendri]
MVNIEHGKGRPLSDDRAGLPTPSTPPKSKDKINLQTPSSASKRKRMEAEKSSPSSRTASKWADWEDKMMMEAVIAAAEERIDWHALASRINGERDPSDQRTLNGIRLHWRQQKTKLIE